MQIMDMKYIYYSFRTYFHLGRRLGSTAMTQFLELPVASGHSAVPELMFISPPLDHQELIMVFLHHQLILIILT